MHAVVIAVLLVSVPCSFAQEMGHDLVQKRDDPYFFTAHQSAGPQKKSAGYAVSACHTLIQRLSSLEFKSEPLAKVDEQDSHLYDCVDKHFKELSRSDLRAAYELVGEIQSAEDYYNTAQTKSELKNENDVAAMRCNSSENAASNQLPVDASDLLTKWYAEQHSCQQNYSDLVSRYNKLVDNYDDIAQRFNRLLDLAKSLASLPPTIITEPSSFPTYVPPLSCSSQTIGQFTYTNCY